jgi:hypothetical protein
MVEAASGAPPPLGSRVLHTVGNEILSLGKLESQGHCPPTIVVVLVASPAV